MPQLSRQNAPLCFNAARPNWAGKYSTQRSMASLTSWLQCGPAQLGREIAHEGNTDRWSKALQCGPAQLGREMTLAWALAGPLAALQCGPAQLGREMRQARPARPAPRRLQCGPAQLGREIFHPAIGCAGGNRFNAARPNWAGKYGLTYIIHGTHVVASMRPGPIGPGNGARNARRRLRWTCFNAARPNWAGK